jgi:hypothetical protein
MLLPHGEIYSLFARKVIAVAEGNKEKAAEMDLACRRLAWECEDTITDVLDCHIFDEIVRTRITPWFK